MLFRSVPLNTISRGILVLCGTKRNQLFSQLTAVIFIIQTILVSIWRKKWVKYIKLLKYLRRKNIENYLCAILFLWRHTPIELTFLRNYNFFLLREGVIPLIQIRNSISNQFGFNRHHGIWHIDQCFWNKVEY